LPEVYSSQLTETYGLYQIGAYIRLVQF